MAQPLLQIKNLDVAYGAVQVVWDLSREVEVGSVVCLIGPNGAAKTTTLNAIAGVLVPGRGALTFRGEEVPSLPAHERVRRRLCLIPEERQLWPRMQVEENLLLGAFPGNLRRNARERLEKIYAMFPLLQERRHQVAGTLSGGEQQMCAIGRGLMAEPELLMLDGPSVGLAPMLVEDVFRLVRKIAEQGVTILLAAQNANYALQVSSYGYVIETGRVALQGPSATLRSNEHVRHAYLGASGSP